MEEGDVLLDFQNYPMDGASSLAHPQLWFGPAEKGIFKLLIEFDTSGGPLKVIVGNGPPHEDAPRAVADVLRSVADAVEAMDESDEYWVAVNALASSQ